MKAQKIILPILLFLFSGALQKTFSQKDIIDQKYWSINVNGTAVFFQGDIARVKWPLISFYEDSWKQAYGLILTRQFNPILSIRGQLLNGKMSGAEKRYINNKTHLIYFESSFIEGNLNFVFNLTNIFFPIRSEVKNVYMYFIIGVGNIQWASTVEDLYISRVIDSDGLHGGAGINGRTFEGVGHSGIGFKYLVNEHFDFTLEPCFRMVNSDKLDATIRSNNWDHYFTISVGVSYKFWHRSNKAKFPIYNEMFLNLKRQTRYKNYTVPLNTTLNNKS